MVDGGVISDYHAEFDTIDENRWHELLKQFDDASIYQTWPMGASRQDRDRLNHLTLKKDGKIVGICQITLNKIPILKTGTADVDSGPLWRKKGNDENLEVFPHMIKALKNEYAEKRGLLLRISPGEFEDSENKILHILLSMGFKQNHSMRRYRTFMLDISPPLETLRKNLGKTWRLHLNRAEKSNLSVIEGSSDELYRIYLLQLNEMLARKRYFSGLDYEKYRLVQNDLPEDLKMRIMVCEFEGEPICSIICSAIGDTGIYLLGATANKGLNLYGSNLLHWRMIGWLKDQGCKWYDLGGIDPIMNPGTYQFKRGLAGKTGKDITRINRVETYNNVRSHLLTMFINNTRFVRSNVKSIYSLTGAFFKKGEKPHL